MRAYSPKKRLYSRTAAQTFSQFLPRVQAVPVSAGALQTANVSDLSAPLAPGGITVTYSRGFAPHSVRSRRAGTQLPAGMKLCPARETAGAC